VTKLSTKYKWIVAHDRAWAGSLAASIRKPKQISVWEVLMPVLLIFNYASAKVTRETFMQNILFTKQMALDAARDMVRKRVGRDEVMLPIKEKTRDLLSTVEEGVYSEAIRQKQLEEIDLLIDHYCKLLNADGNDFVTLVRGAYPDRGDYLDFLGRLKKAETRVHEASLETVGSRGDRQFVTNLEQTTERVRMTSVDTFYKERG
jgi:hypothetical protein